MNSSLAVKNGAVQNNFSGEEQCNLRLVDDLLSQAVQKRASDIHLEPLGTRARIRLRIDGELHEIGSISLGTYLSWVSRLKIISGMDIAEKRIPQDGHLEFENMTVDMRISTLPTIFGEKVVIRILNKKHGFLEIESLQFSEENRKLYEKLYSSAHGMVLLTGPTGSGKTTTLYATLNELNKENVNIITIEDPVEYKLLGVNQVSVNNKSGLTFARGLRSIVRQDPNIIMVGEIRDKETASIGLQAALTGHRVFSTLHSNTAIGTVSRLIDMGIPRYLLTSALRGVVGQRLVRQICHNCASYYHASRLEKIYLGKPANEELVLRKGTGCPHCNGTGFFGRIALHEVWTVTEAMAVMIAEGKTESELLKAATDSGFKSLREDGLAKVMAGQTTVTELLREGLL